MKASTPSELAFNVEKERASGIVARSDLPPNLLTSTPSEQAFNVEKECASGRIAKSKVPLNLLARLYRQLFDRFKGNPEKLTLFTMVILVISEWPIYFFTLLDILKLKSLFKYRLHYDPSVSGHLGIRKYPPNDLIWSTYKVANFNFFFAYVIPGSLFIKLGAKLGIYVYDHKDKDVTWWRVAKEVLLISVWSDVFFYALHRTFHLAAYYKKYHKKHHEFKYSMALAHHFMEFTEAPIFGLCQAMPPIYYWLITGRKCHLVSMWAAFFFTQLNVIFGHAGWQIPFIPKWFPLFQPHYHDFHHVDYKVNFGAIYPFVDMAFGTYAKPAMGRALAMD